MDPQEQSAPPPVTPGSSDPAAEQSPVATENQKTITGDPGFGEQQPRSPLGNADAPVASSAPPPGAQSGMPLPEDRAAQAANVGDAAPAGEPVEGEPEEPDGAEGEEVPPGV